MNSNRRSVVSDFFSKKDYLINSSDRIKVRAAIVKKYVSNGFFNSVLDVGCGDGSISLPSCMKFNSLLLNDISDEMIKRCLKNIPTSCTSIVHVFQGDIFDGEFPQGKFDLIICIGVIAHVDEPLVFIERLHDMLSDGGMIIIETTEKPYPIGEFLSRLSFFNYHAKQNELYLSYNKHRVKISTLHNFFTQKGYSLIGEEKFSLPFPGMSKLHQKLKTFYTFATWRIPLLSYFSSEYIACFRK